MNVIVIGSYFEQNGNLGQDIIALITVIVPELIGATLFFHINKENVIASIVENVQIYENDKYKQMFDSLQEGVLVINTPLKDIKETQTLKTKDHSML